MATVSSQKSSQSLLELFNTTRARTLEIVQTLEKDDFVVQTADFMSPPKWHLGHVSWLYEVVMSKTSTNYQFYSKEFSEYLNSYYQQFGTLCALVVLYHKRSLLHYIPWNIIRL